MGAGRQNVRAAAGVPGSPPAAMGPSRTRGERATERRNPRASGTVGEDQAVRCPLHQPVPVEYSGSASHPARTGHATPGAFVIDPVQEVKC